MPDEPDDAQRDFAARQHEHAARVRLELEMQRQSGKSLSEVRAALRSEDVDRRFMRYADAARPREVTAPQRPPAPAIQITSTTLPKRQLIPVSDLTAGSTGDASGPGGEAITIAADGKYLVERSGGVISYFQVDVLAGVEFCVSGVPTTRDVIVVHV